LNHLDGQLEDLTASTVMVVDDEPTIIDVLETFLEGEGYTNLVTTTDSRRALPLLSTKSVDLVLLDLNMPHVDGFEILESIRSNDELKHTPVIILTSDTSSETKLKALELGATDFLGKPVDPSELALRLRNTLAAKAYRDRLAYYDVVTGLPNRIAFVERTERALRRARHDSRLCAVLHISLGQFERINDTLGHHVGDELLRTLARRLENCVRSSDVVGVTPSQGRRALSRVGGGEFALFLPAAGSAEFVANVARRVVASVEEPFNLQGEDLFVTCSVGIALAPEDGDDPQTLLRHARMANGKQDSPNDFAFYSKAVNVDSLARLSLENQLRRALDRGEMVLHYQPQLDIRSGRIIGTEALMRWQHPDLGLVPPDRFIPIAEETGVISDLGGWAIHEACRQNKAWQDAGLAPIRVSVNVSTQQFQRGDLMRTVRTALRDSGMDATLLVLELTEGMIMPNPNEAAEMLQEMKTMNLNVSVDDFGTGYSALSYLQRFPLSELKIDRSFVQGIPQDLDGVAIVSAIIAMARSLGLRLVAEGVETKEQLEFLRRRGCDEFQGFLFSRPLPADACAGLIGDPTTGPRGC